MKILVVYKEDYPWDVRVEKIVNALNEDGHEVTIAANNTKKKSSKEKVGGNEIYRLPAMKWLPNQIAQLFKLPLWFNPFWYFLFSSLIRRKKFDLIVIRDLPLLKLAVIFKRKTGVPVIYDMAEVYPEMYRSIQQYENFSFKGWLLKNPIISERYEKDVISDVDHTLVMIEESRDRLLKMDVPAKKVSIVSNTPPLQKYNGSVMQHSGRALNIVYVGRLTRLRGIDLLIRGVEDFLRRGNSQDTIKVDIVGTGPDKVNLQKLVSTLGLEACVNIHGWLEQDDVDAMMMAANVGVVSYRVCSHWNHTIPNKIFDYMLAGIPVLSTPVTTIGRIVRAHECGIVCSSELPGDIGKALEELTDPNLRQELGQRGRQAVIDQFNWEQEKKTLRRVVRELVPSPMKAENLGSSGERIYE